MTRPMPEPPETMPPVHDLSRPPVGPDGQSDWDTWRRWKEQDDREWRTTQDKRLKDAEAAAEYWRAEANAIGSDAVATHTGSAAVRRVASAWDAQAATWHRLATLPHALEVDA